MAALLGLTGPTAATADTRTRRYIVSTSTSAGTEQTLRGLSRAGTRPRHRFDRVLPGFAADLTPGQVTRLEADPRVRSVDEDRVLRVSTTQSGVPWGLDRIDQGGRTGSGTYSYTTTGAGVTVFEIDTGVRTSHGDLGGRATSGWDFVDSDATAEDCHGHGTHVAGTVAGSTYGVAKQAELVALRVMDCSGDGYESDFVAALQWVLEHRPDGPAVVNISAGGGVSEPLDTAVGKVVAAGVAVVVAAGNDDDDACGGSPARAPAALTVAATGADDRRAGYSNWGRCVDVFAPGSGVRSTGTDSDTATASMSGTSMAAPHVTGGVARYLQANPRATPAQVREALVGDATPGVVGDRAGSADRLLYLRRAAPGAPRSVSLTRSDPTATLTLGWRAPDGFGAPAATGYRLTSDAAGVGSTSADLTAGTRSHTFTGLTPGVTYAISVRALGAAGPGKVATASASLLAKPGPGRVLKPSAGSTSDHPISVTARWSAPALGGAVASYEIQTRRADGSTLVTATASGTARHRTVSGLSRGRAYVVRVRAANAAGRGAWSAWSSAATAR